MKIAHPAPSTGLLWNPVDSLHVSLGLHKLLELAKDAYLNIVER